MCGITGFVGGGTPKELRQMAISLHHRGPDGEGFFFEEGTGLAMRRLAIIDLEKSTPPLFNETEELVLVFNGEIYNYRELRRRLLRSGHRFRTDGDGEVILHLYEEHGEQLLEHLAGMFAFALWDRRKKRLLLARDRLGIKPLYYQSVGRRLLFASELQALEASQTPPRELHLEALSDYLTYLAFPTPKTIYREVFQLPPASRLIWQDGTCSIDRYWHLPSEKEPLSFQEAAAACRQQLKKIIGDHLISDVPLGLFLSGGLDSATLLALAEPKPKTFSIGFEAQEDRDYDESPLAEQVARFFGSEHTTLKITRKEANCLFEEAISKLDQPLADASLLLTYVLSQAVRREIKVALSGIGGDELFSGYPRYLALKLTASLPPCPLPAKLAHLFPTTFRKNDWSGRVHRFLKALSVDAAKRYALWRMATEPETLKRLWPDAVVSTDPVEGPYRQAPAPSPLDRAFYADLLTYLADDLLAVADRLGMAASLEIRVPFCDHRLVEWCAALPPEVRCKGFGLKPLLKAAMRDLLPPFLFKAPKRGFTPPLALWFRSHLKSRISTLPQAGELLALGFRPESLREIVLEHLSGRWNHFDLLFALEVLRVWLKARAISI